MSASVTSSYNTLMTDLSNNGTDTQTLKNDASGFESALKAQGGAGGSATTAAADDMSKSIDDGTFSQQGSQGALQAMASKDGLSGVNVPQIGGNSGQAHQDSGDYSAGKNGSLGANLDILKDEIKAGPSDLTQVHNNASALAKEAKNSGDSSLSSAAQNIANSTTDKTYDGGTSSKALDQAT